MKTQHICRCAAMLGVLAISVPAADLAGRVPLVDGKTLNFEIDGGQLEAYYHRNGNAPDVTVAVSALTGDDPAKAAKASRFLITLAQRTLDDEASGKAPWHATPFWGSEGENPARELRGRMARLVAKIAPEHAAAGSPAVVPVLEWFIRKERLVPPRVGCMDALAKVRSKEADALITSLAADPGLPHGLSAVAIRQAAERKLDLPEPILLDAVRDHHRNRRTAAVDSWQARKPGEPPPAFDPVAALQTPPVRKLLDDLAKMALDLPPTDARWGKVERKSPGSDRGKPVERVETEWGWVLEDKDRRLRLLTLHGRIHDFTLGQNKDWRGPATISFTEVTMEDMVKMIEKLRADGDSEHRLSEQGGFSGQFQGTAAGIPEMLLFEGGEIQTFGGFDSVAWCRQLEARGNPAGLAYFRRLLDEANRAKPNLNLPALGDSFIEGYAGHDAAIRALGERTKPDSDERLAALRKWLDERIRQTRPPSVPK